MSFILDALKKSENDRQRQSGPAVFEVKVAKPKSGLPMWAVALAGLLIINLGIVIWRLVRSPSRAQAVAATPPPTIAPTVTVAVAPPPAVSPPVVTPPQTVPPPAEVAEDVDAEGVNPEDYEPAIE